MELRADLEIAIRKLALRTSKDFASFANLGMCVRPQIAFSSLFPFRDGIYARSTNNWYPSIYVLSWDEIFEANWGERNGTNMTINKQTYG